MAGALDSNDLNRLPDVRESTKGFFSYHRLSADEDPPAGLEAHFRLARREAEQGEDRPERLRLALVTGYDHDADWLDCLAYVWRAESGDVVWSLERWEGARKTLDLYTRDSGFDGGGSLEAIHRRYREGGGDAVASDVRRIAGGD